MYKLLLLTLMATLGSATPLVTIYSDLNPDPQHRYTDSNEHLMLEGVEFPYGVQTASQQIAVAFTTPQSTDPRFPGISGWLVTQISVAVRNDLGGYQSADIFLYADSDGRPGPAIASGVVNQIGFNVHGAPGINCCDMARLVFGSRIGLLPSRQYWLGVQPVGGVNLGDVWYDNNLGLTGTVLKSDRLTGAWRDDGSILPAFEVLGFEVSPTSPQPIADPPVTTPDPGTALLAFSGLLLLGSSGCHFRSARASRC